MPPVLVIQSLTLSAVKPAPKDHLYIKTSLRVPVGILFMFNIEDAYKDHPIDQPNVVLTHRWSYYTSFTAFSFFKFVHYLFHIVSLFHWWIKWLKLHVGLEPKPCGSYQEDAYDLKKFLYIYDVVPITFLSHHAQMQFSTWTFFADTFSHMVLGVHSLHNAAGLHWLPHYHITSLPYYLITIFITLGAQRMHT